MKRKFCLAALVLALCFALSGSAWATEAEVIDRINAYYGVTAAVGDGNGNITVTGTKASATETLHLGDISGLTIDWGAQVTGDFISPSEEEHFELIDMYGDGAFNINDGAEIKLSGTVNNLRHVYLIRAEDIDGHPTVTTINVNGGTLEALMPNATAIDRDSELPPIININGGTINIPRGTVAVGEVTLYNADGVTGTVIKQPHGQLWSDNNWPNWSIELYGACSAPTTFEDNENNEKTIESISWRIMPGATATVEEGATWSIRESWTLQNEGTLDIYGTVINFDQFVNNGIINNYSSNTLDNRGTLSNNGTISNKSTGVITNSGTIDNASGKINNEGKITNSGTIKSDAANYIGNAPEGKPIQPISDSETSSDSGGGCNAGFGVLGLLIAGLVTRKCRLIRLNSPK